MKTIFSRLFKFPPVIFMAIFSCYNLPVKSAEFLIMDKVVSYTYGNAFSHCISNYENYPENWLSPDDYYHGTFYAYYKVLDVPTNIPFGMQIGIFQYHPSRADYDGSFNEVCSPVSILTGIGDEAYYSGTPNNWWKNEGRDVDFSRVYDFQSLGPILYGSNPTAPLIWTSGGGNDATWDQRANWMPCTIKVVIVAVSSESTFSGWSNYLIDPSLRKPTPTYGIDYINETTDKLVPSNDMYCKYSNMSGAQSGSGQKVTLTPGAEINFKTIAGDGLLESEVQHIEVPCRPATPTFTLDVANHRTVQVVSSDYEYCDFADFADAVSGAGTYVTIPAGTTKYFRKKATGTSFASGIQALCESYKAPKAHEFVIFNGFAEWPNSTDTNGFYYFNYNADMPANWLSPDDYHYGMIYIRYELISKKTTAPIGLQFGIWQMLPSETGELHETMSEIRRLDADGQVVTSSGSLSVSSNYWALDHFMLQGREVGIDLTQMDNTWHFGINPWQITPESKQIRQENADVWAVRNTNWFPMKAYVTVIAVASGYNFSGFNYYLGVKQPLPKYTINYSIEQTSEVIPTTDEYSFSPTMSPSYSGSGSALNLEPGQTVYFRTKAQGSALASDVQRMIVPERPVISSITTDYVNESTNQNITSDIEYTTDASFTSPQTGNGNKITVTPGQDLYFRKYATATSYVSDTYHLVVPSRPEAPSVSINFSTEKTNEVVSATIEYATNPAMTGSTSCSNAALDLTPGVDLYFRVKSTGSSFVSAISTLDVPVRPATPAITLDYVTEMTSAVASSTEWSENASFSPATDGNGTEINTTPGTDLYFRVKATASSFKSAAQHLVVPQRPSTPFYSINYLGEATSEAISSADDYSTNSNMNGAIAGTNSYLSLTPGTDLYFRTRATSSSFYSLIQTLDVPARPSTPEFSINYAEISTNEAVNSNIEYSTNGNLSDPDYGTGSTLALEPGQNLYFRQKAGASSFHSNIFELNVPNQNFLGYSGGDTVTGTNFVMYAILVDGVEELSLDDIQVTNGEALNLREGNIFDIYPATNDYVHVIIPANSTSANTFVSNEVVVFYDGPVALGDYQKNDGFSIHPNPCYDGLVTIETTFDLPYSIDILTGEGRLIKKIRMDEGKYQQLTMEDLQKGIYFLKIYTSETILVHKLILE
jgi:hypothetical protein